jgi:deoxyribonuclease-4
MKYVGAHVSVAGGVSNAPLRAKNIGAKAFALFTGSSNRWSSKPISDKEASLFKERCKEFGFTPDVILPHDNFLINLGSPDAEKLSMSRKSFIDEMKRCEQLGLNKLNFHPGSHLNQIDVNDCLDRIAESINLALLETSGVKAVLENTAGQGSNLGYRFEQLARIISGVDDKRRVGVCIDTCHAYSAGYDLASDGGYTEVWEEFDRIIGLGYLSGMHINDDKREFASRIDRHESIGKGTLGESFFTRLMNDNRFDGIPLILETPDDTLWSNEIKWLYSQMS